MDTWATASLTPQIVCGWGADPELFALAFPMALRPQGPEIIRTWLFSTVLRSHFENRVLPWRHATINGWILDPDRKKMSKSKGNVVTPAALIAAHGADGVRYWACRAAPGTDTAVDEQQMRIGRRLAVKLLNASKFVIGLGASEDAGSGSVVTESIDLAMLGRLDHVIGAATRAFEDYQYQQALERSETFFWQFCDDYVELVKDRAYGMGDGAVSARSALASALSAVQRLFAPFLPFVTAEVWSWWQEGSVHRAPWPVALEKGNGNGSVDSFELAATVLREVRKAKTLAKLGIKTRVARLVVEDIPERLAVFRLVSTDVCAAGVVDELELRDAEAFRVAVELA
jgi:valyl-tRNA synthetase